MPSTRKEAVPLGAAHRRRVVYDAESPQEVWSAVLSQDEPSIKAISTAMKEQVFDGPLGIFARIAAELAYPLYQSHGHYIKDSDLFADVSGVLSRPEMALVQRQYTLAHALCSTAAFWDPAAGEMVCMRSLDWPAADALAEATRIYDFEAASGGNRSSVVGITGMCGILTGMKHGGFSVAINYAPKPHSAQMRSDPTFKIRQLLENPGISTYAQARADVQAWKVGAPCFITLCGKDRGEACVIEFGQRTNEADGTHAMNPREVNDAGWIVQTNHFDKHGRFGALFDGLGGKPPTDPFCADPSDTTVQRRELIEQELPGAIGAGGAAMEQRLLDLWMTEPVLNYESVHIALMRPRSGSIRVWKLESRGAKCPE